MNPEDGEIEVVFYYNRNNGITSSFMVNEEGVVYGMDFPEDLPELESLHDQGWLKEEANNILRMIDQRLAGKPVTVEYK